MITMFTSQLLRKAEHEEQGKGVKDAMGRVENLLIIVGDGVRWGDLLAANDPIHQNAGPVNSNTKMRNHLKQLMAFSLPKNYIHLKLL